MLHSLTPLNFEIVIYYIQADKRRQHMMALPPVPEQYQQKYRRVITAHDLVRYGNHFMAYR